MSKKIIRNLAVMFFLSAAIYVVNARSFLPLVHPCSCNADPGCTCGCAQSQDGRFCDCIYCCPGQC